MIRNTGHPEIDAQSPTEQVLSQLARQKWAVDTRDAVLLRAVYTADSEQVIYRGGPQGQEEFSRLRGRDEIVDHITAGWARSAATWYPGKMIHQIGSCLVEPAGERRIRCRSYASFLGLDEAGTPVLKGYGSYDDMFVLDGGRWLLARRENVIYGLALSR
jgi:hypothetical protein